MSENAKEKNPKNDGDLWGGENPERVLPQDDVPNHLLMVNVEGFEGPLDLLLELSRHQKVDLAKISILALAEQYLIFIEEARKLRIELAADYLVMAAWLAYLKSKLLLPDLEEEEGPSGEEMAAQLAHRLKRLEAMREMGNRLINRNRLGRDFFVRGMPEAIVVEKRKEYTASLYDLLTAYAAQRQRQSVSIVTIAKRQVWSLQDARDYLSKLVGGLKDWAPLDSYLMQYISDPAMLSSAIASTFAASLELVKEGRLELRQEKAFSTLYLKSAAINRANDNPDITISKNANII